MTSLTITFIYVMSNNLIFKGGCVVPGYNMHRVSGKEATVFQHECDVSTVSYCTERLSSSISESTLNLHS